ncbi:hypothetical protein CIG19_05130 [Enterobacterales bacterium CwR94]|nr:hypothetical protein CIG19_05130 [Enterobacterales bacterium CwR94]
MRTVKQWFIDWMKGEIRTALFSLLLVVPVIIVAMLDVTYFPDADMAFTGYYILFHLCLWVYLVIKLR